MSYFRPNIDAMEGYTPGEQPKGDDFIKLNTNENPYPPSMKVYDAIREEVNTNLRKYPDPVCQAVRDKAAVIYGLTADQIIVGNGSDDLLTMICRAFVSEGELIVQPYPTYSLYEALAQIQNAKMKSIPFTEFNHLPEDLAVPGAKVTFVANPNSPTGTVVSFEELSEFAGRIKGILVVDEAYVDFGERNSLPLVQEHDNVIILRTFSKSFSMAGLRVGLGFAHPGLIHGLMKVKDSYNVSRISQAAALAALEDTEYTEAMIGRVRSTRGRLVVALQVLGLHVYSSHSNFLWVRCSQPSAKSIYEELKLRKILVRFFNHPGLDDCIRITVGTDDQTDTLIDALKDLMG
ncbi:MAG: histidinol-phosphate transaminase [Planctomycetota bacterium]|nr:histidinol-phosphate transaminase [Planctomycetota bacterium]